MDGGLLNTLSNKPKSKKRKIPPRLTSIENLMKTVQEASHEGLSKVFKNFTFVGCVDTALALLQYETDLFLVNVCILSVV